MLFCKKELGIKCLLSIFNRMTGQQFRELRTQRGLSRGALAEQFHAAGLGCSESTIQKWENETNTIPGWAAKHMLQHVPLSLDLVDLTRLIDMARERGIRFDELLKEAVLDYIAQQMSRAVIPMPEQVPAQRVAEPGADHEA